jgi:hypothetical protein
VDFRVYSGVIAKGIVVFHELTTGLFVETRLWKGNNKQALDDFENVLQRPLRWVPVPLEGIYADVSRRRGHVRMENFGEKETFWRASGEAGLQHKFAPEYASVVWCFDGTNDVGLDV